MDHLRSIKMLSSGKYIEVHKVKNITSDELLIIKQFNLVNVNTLHEKKSIENEINILDLINKYNHPNMIKFYNFFQSAHHIFLALEYCNGGNLYDNLEQYKNKYGKPFPEDLVQILMKKILNGVKFLHSNGIIHRDLRLKNIVLQYNNDFDLNNKNIYKANVKIIDFNYSQMPNNYKTYHLNLDVQNIEPLSNDINVYYDEKIDILSLGILCYQMLFGKPLFGYMTNEQIYININNLLNNVQIPKTISNQAKSFLYCMIQKEGNKRWSAKQLLKSEFITGVYQNFTKNQQNIKKKTMVHSKTNIGIFQKTNNFKNNFFPTENNINKNNICKNCGKIISDCVFKCEKCENLIYCKKCYEKNCLTHHHAFEVSEINYNNNNNYYNNNNQTNYYSNNNNNNYTNYYITNNKNNNYNNNYHMINCVFNTDLGSIVVITQFSNITVRKLLEYYFVKINRPDLMYDYNNKIRFIHDGKYLNKCLDLEIGKALKGINPSILVYGIDKF